MLHTVCVESWTVIFALFMLLCSLVSMAAMTASKWSCQTVWACCCCGICSTQTESFATCALSGNAATSAFNDHVAKVIAMFWQEMCSLLTHVLCKAQPLVMWTGWGILANTHACMVPNDECPPQAKRMELMNLHGTEKIISGEQAVAHFAACLVQKSCVKVCLWKPIIPLSPRHLFCLQRWRKSLFSLAGWRRL